MSALLTVLLPALIVIMLMAPVVPVMRGAATGARVKRSMIFNLCAFFGVMALVVLLPVGDFIAMAAEEGETILAGLSTGTGLAYIAAALAAGLSAVGAGIAVAAAAPAAIGATSEDPKAFGKAIIFVVLGEGVAIYGLLVAILIINNL